jgi:hypothetical protein
MRPGTTHNFRLQLRLTPDLFPTPQVVEIFQSLFLADRLRRGRGILFASVPSMDRPIGRVPRFKIGDEVIVVGLGSYKGKEGVVVHVTTHSGDFVHRYEVRLSDGTVTRFFGFELEFIISASA